MAAAAFMVCMPWSWFGLLLVYFMEDFEISRETASWPKSIASVLSHVSGLAVYGLQQYIKTYYIVLISTILTSAGFIFSAFASNILWMSMTLGVMHGLGHGVFVTSATVYTLLHFEKYRGIATSLAFIAYGASSVISQIVLAGLVELYDIGGALLVYGGVLLNSTVVVMLAKNPWPLRLSRKQGQSEPLLKKDIESTCYEAATNNTSSKQSPEDQCLIMPEKKMLPESCSLKQALELFYAPSFYVLLVTVVVGDYTNTEFSATIVDYGMDKGIHQDHAKHLVTFSAIGQVVGRVAVPLQSDFSPFMRHFLYTLSFLALCCCMAAMPYVSAWSTTLALSAVIGASEGYILCIKYVLLAEYLGVERTAVAIGMIGILMTPALLVSPKILGLFRDVAGSYDGYYRLMATLSLMAALLFAGHDAWIHRKRKRRHSVNHKSPTSEAT
ncbi:monocarboxylate transporter 12-like [Rhipicephalus microplus]|uniref:monocarboxylate transporter 12-like n=1 Tax=Rhipicephalus microplus TaxID=6941 RepID=UPI003F6C56A2